MLVEFKVSNFRSFKEKVVFSMEPLKQNEKNINVINTGFDEIPQLFRSSGIFGANASGKSNLIKVIDYLTPLLKNSSKNSKDDKLLNESYALGTNEFDEPTAIEIQFIENKKLYKYAFEIYNNVVKQESLHFCSAGQNLKFRRIFERSNNNGKINFCGIEESFEVWSNETLDNRLFLSEIVNNRRCQNEHILNAYKWLIDKLRTLDSESLPDIFSIQQIYKGKGEKIIDLVKKADLGLDNIRVERASYEELLNFIGNKETIKTILNKEDVFLNTISSHKTEAGIPKMFNLNKMESAGTKNFLALAGPLLDVIQNGKIIFVDELDAALHPELVKYLVEIFNNEETNPNNAQLIFVSHAHYLMDGETLTRDQIWITTKEFNNGFYSDLYSLSDFEKNEKYESFYEKYMLGIYGGIPFVNKS